MNNNIAAHQDLSPDNQAMITLSSNFEERSDIAQEIISRKPDFFEKWAMLFFLVLLLFLTLCTWFIKYPDIIKADAILTGSNAPKEIIPRQTGRLTALFATNNQDVKQGEIIGWMESGADPQEIIDLRMRLDSSVKMIESDQPQLIAGLFNKRFSNLGELQVSYQTFISAWQKYNDYLISGFYARRKKFLGTDIASLQGIREKLDVQKNIRTEDHTIASQTFEMYKSLYEQKVISLEEFRKAQANLLNKQLSIPQNEVSIIFQQNQIRDKQKELDQLDHDILQQQQTFEQALQTLRSSVGEWLRRYTIQAPVSGKIVLALPLQQGQHLEEGKLLGYINPSDSKYYMEIKLEQKNFGKVDTGMKVQLRFDAYPYQESGFLPGTLDYISNVAVDSVFLGTVRLNSQLVTNQNKTIQYKSGLKAQAVIITRDMRLLERLYYSVVRQMD
jgi:multidrug resistance efflux pump